MKKVSIYTDGACSGPSGLGGWGAVLFFGEHMREISGAESGTTNQRMELTAAIKALEALNEPCEVHLHSDSAYLINAFYKEWIFNWYDNGWLTAKGEPVKNQDLWGQLLQASNHHNIYWIKVKGHADNEWNNRADKLATGAIKEARK